MDQQAFEATSPTVGKVMAVRGSKAQIELLVSEPAASPRVTVGSFLSIQAGNARLIAVITEVADDHTSHRPVACVDLVGEIRAGEDASFQRGVSSYPSIGDRVTALEPAQMGLIYNAQMSRSITIGHLAHDRDTPAKIDVDAMVQRHFAILGSTGVGKSTGVTIILRETLAVRPDLRVFLLDCHNEYGRAFGDKAYVVNSRDLKLPFWLFNFEEFVDVIFSGRPAVEEELEILSELIPIAKTNYLQYSSKSDRLLRRADARSSGFTVDTPVPYLLQDLMALLDERMGKLENRASRMTYHRLMTRIDMIRNNPRYDFMFENANVGGDTMAELLRQLFRIDADGKPITIMQLAGLPVEVVDAVVCVLCRLAFDFGLWSEGAVPLLFVCEEAHRYASLDQAIGFAPTRRALSRIAKEGRKYGVFLGLVSQRPSELDPNIISQCATLFAMRMANDRDQALLRSAVSDATADLLAFVPSLATREMIGFGEGVPFPARMKFKTLDQDHLLRSDTASHQGAGFAGAPASPQFVQDVVDRWRRAVTGRKVAQEEPAPPVGMTVPDQISLISANARLDQARHQLLQR